LSRRNFLKAAVLLAAAVLLIPLERLSQFMSVPQKNGPTTYPRLRIANTSDVPLNGSLLFDYPDQNRGAVLIHLPEGFMAYDAVCTHLGCQVHYDQTVVAGWENNPNQVFCSCHGGVFDPKTGNVLAGPPPRPLPKIKLDIDNQGDIYADGYESGLPLYGEA
jgi:Rieske Fe-S protein